MTKTLLALGAALLISSVSLAAPETMVIDPDHTFARFSYNHMGFSTQEQRFNKTDGTIVYDPVAKTASVEIVIDTKSIDTGSEVFNGHIQSATHLDTATYPTATFKSTSVKFDGDTPTQMDGNLTIKGITKPVSFKITAFKHAVHPMRHADAIGAAATAVIKRSDFNAAGGVPMISDEVNLTIAIEAHVPVPPAAAAPAPAN
jgi:polyisoprenoid-binding protein YceI